MRKRQGTGTERTEIATVWTKVVATPLCPLLRRQDSQSPGGLSRGIVRLLVQALGVMSSWVSMLHAHPPGTWYFSALPPADFASMLLLDPFGNTRNSQNIEMDLFKVAIYF